jgi:thiosulfate reductase cytochrome b subunit
MDNELISIVDKHPRALRIFHWINVPLLILMIWSGILIYWADQAFLKIPPELAKSLGIDYRLARGMGWHFSIMWFFTINGIGYITYLVFSGQWQNLIKKTQGKYNAAQRVAYCGVILMALGSIVTGLAIYRPVQLGTLTWLLGGYELTRFWHFLLTIGFILFIMVHVFQVIRAGWNNFRGMIAGYEIEKD